ncbi:hypothetical protein [Methylovirgula sp. 4M-Z18]|uniref:hypothetical protein n=1 Tax=Methylovirgula sp. 4M-Z18 TaxID=2293567 RepID=UPI000E2EBE0A|nr:hypothetical protein [Methylovirgula sp. 4M-Z18]RFB80436.1 hypothetical protein DYH55_02590 [Methylovirgula sp. 4M-Z18]
MTWKQSFSGNAIELHQPRVEQVHFSELVEEMAGVYRWAGSAMPHISVAFHTIIAVECAPRAAQECGVPDSDLPLLIAQILLHDAHETRLGEIPSPALWALDAIAGELHDLPDMASRLIGEFKRRHDIVIYQAAGVPLPIGALARAVKRADAIALMTERRDYLGKSKKPWGAELEAIQPLKRKLKYLGPADAAIKLKQLFNTYLPALNRQQPIAAA